MARIVVGVEYDGINYSGWQRQPFSVPTVQGHIEQALSRIANQEINITCAGRTDAGVHALGQVFHFDSDAERDPFSWVAGGNHYLPKDIRLQWAQPVSEAFHARYCALKRTYVYYIAYGGQPSALWRNRLYWHRYPLSAQTMQRAAQHLCGEHDFSAFRAADCQSHTPWRYIERIQVISHANLLSISVIGNAFLHHMVRNIVGCLLEVGDGRKPEHWVKSVLLSKQRKEAGITAPAHGLYFQHVEYENKFNLPVMTAVPLDLFASFS